MTYNEIIASICILDRQTDRQDKDLFTKLT